MRASKNFEFPPQNNAKPKPNILEIQLIMQEYHCVYRFSFFPADIPVHLFKRPSQEYTEEQKKFATTVHFHSPKAYEYLREHVHLPYPSTIRWCINSD